MGIAGRNLLHELSSYSLCPQYAFIIDIMCVHAQLCPILAIPWTVAHQASLSMGFSRQEYWSGLPFPPPGDHPDPGIKPRSPASSLLLRFFIT